MTTYLMVFILLASFSHIPRRPVNTGVVVDYFNKFIVFVVGDIGKCILPVMDFSLDIRYRFRSRFICDKSMNAIILG
jgi:hypothetical protein